MLPGERKISCRGCGVEWTGLYSESGSAQCIACTVKEVLADAANMQSEKARADLAERKLAVAMKALERCKSAEAGTAHATARMAIAEIEGMTE